MVKITDWIYTVLQLTHYISIQASNSDPQQKLTQKSTEA